MIEVVVLEPSRFEKYINTGIQKYSITSTLIVQRAPLSACIGFVSKTAGNVDCIKLRNVKFANMYFKV